MASHEELIRGYAEALFAVAKAEGVESQVEDELFAFSKALEQNPNLREALTDAALPAENRKAVISDLLSERSHPLTVSLLGFVVDSGRARELPAIAEKLASLGASSRSHVMAEVRSAVPLDDAQSQRLAQALSKATGKDIDVKVVVDPTVVGGIVARVGDEVFDGSISSRLSEAKQHIGS